MQEQRPRALRTVPRRSRRDCSSSLRCFVPVPLRQCLPFASFRGSPTHEVCSVGARGQGGGKGVYLKRVLGTERSFFFFYENNGWINSLRSESLSFCKATSQGESSAPSVTPEATFLEKKQPWCFAAIDEFSLLRPPQSRRSQETLDPCAVASHRATQG